MRMSQCPQGEAALTDRLPRTSEVVDVAPQGIAIKSPAPIKRKKAKAKSPTQRSLEHMRKLGYLCDIVERRVPFQFVTKDLFGFIDILCVKGEDIIGVQATSAPNAASRVTKITEHENWPLVCKAIRVIVHGWRRNAKGRWTLREVEL